MKIYKYNANGTWTPVTNESLGYYFQPSSGSVGSITSTSPYTTRYGVSFPVTAGERYKIYYGQDITNQTLNPTTGQVRYSLRGCSVGPAATSQQNSAFGDVTMTYTNNNTEITFTAPSWATYMNFSLYRGAGTTSNPTSTWFNSYYNGTKTFASGWIEADLNKRQNGAWVSGDAHTYNNSWS